VFTERYALGPKKQILYLTKATVVYDVEVYTEQGIEYQVSGVIDVKLRLSKFSKSYC